MECNDGEDESFSLNVCERKVDFMEKESRCKRAKNIEKDNRVKGGGFSFTVCPKGRRGKKHRGFLFSRSVKCFFGGMVLSLSLSPVIIIIKVGSRVKRPTLNGVSSIGRMCVCD